MRILISGLLSILTILPATSIEPEDELKTLRNEGIQNLLLPGEVTIRGRLEGYDPATDPKIITLKVDDIVKNESYERVLPVNQDGSFGRTLTIPAAQMTYLRLAPGYLVDVYLEPGETLTLDMNIRDISSGKIARMEMEKSVNYGGSLAETNRQIAFAPSLDYLYQDQFGPDMTQGQVKDSINRVYEKNRRRLNDYISTLPDDNKAGALLKASLLANKLFTLFDYAEFNESHKLLPQSYYHDFVNETLTTDSLALMTRSSDQLLNRLGFSRMLPSRRRKINREAVDSAMNLLAAHGVELTEAEQDKISVLKNDEIEMMEMLWACSKLINASERGDVEKEMRTLLVETDMDVARYMEVGYSERVDNDYISALSFGEELPKMWQYAIAARNFSIICNSDSLDLGHYGITDPTLTSRLTSEYEKAHTETGPVALPDDPLGFYMKSLIEPYKGKYLLVDVWDIYCPPCRENIERYAEFRRNHKNNPDFAILFICTEEGSPMPYYQQYVDKYMESDEKVRIPDDNMAMLRELFNFTGIPHYVIFDPEGRAIDTDASMWGYLQLLRDKEILID